jgi:hypothetical protein
MRAFAKRPRSACDGFSSGIMSITEQYDGHRTACPAGRSIPRDRKIVHGRNRVW